MAFLVKKAIESGVASAMGRGRIVQSTRMTDPAGFERIVHGLTILAWGSGLLGAIGLIAIGRIVYSNTKKQK